MQVFMQNKKFITDILKLLHTSLKIFYKTSKMSEQNADKIKHFALVFDSPYHDPKTDNPFLDIAPDKEK